MMLRYLLLVIALMLSMSVSAVTVYKWVDQNGATVFSDQPRPGAVPVQLPQAAEPPGAASTQQQPPKQLVSPTGKAPASDDMEKEGYEQLSIVIPQDGDTVRDNSGNMQVSLALKPTLKQGDKVELLIDGKVAGQAQATTNFQITAIERGEHTLQAQVVNSAGTVVIKSASIKFFMHQAHVNKSGRISS